MIPGWMFTVFPVTLLHVHILISFTVNLPVCLEFICGQNVCTCMKHSDVPVVISVLFAAGPRLVISCSRTVLCCWATGLPERNWEPLWRETLKCLLTAVCVCVYQSDAVTVGVRHCSRQPIALYVTHTHTHTLVGSTEGRVINKQWDGKKEVSILPSLDRC